MARNWKKVLDLASRDVSNGRPFNSEYDRRNVMTTSRPTIAHTVQPGTRPTATNAKSAEEMKTLSANGSKNVPQRVTNPHRRAPQPSYQSVSIAMTKTASESCRIVGSWERYIPTKTGVSRIRRNVS